MQRQSVLSKEQRDRLQQINWELKRRKREERIRYFKPTEPPGNDQKAFLHSPAKIRAAFGGNRSGKTEIGVADGIYFMQGKHPIRSAVRQPPVFIRYCAPKYEDGIKAVVLKKFQELVPRCELLGGSWRSAWSERSRTLSFANGSQCRFFSYEQDVNTYGGADIDGFYMDEHAPEKYFIENVARTVDRNGFGVLTMTPEAGITWEEERIIEASETNDKIDFWYFSTFDNPHLSKDGVAELASLITDERLRDAKLRGRFVALSGMVYPQFDRSIHVIPDKELHRDWHRQCLVDPHHRKPTSILWLAWSPDGECFAYREAEFPPTAGGVPELAAFIKTKSSGDRIIQFIADEAMGGKGLNIYGETSVIEQLNANGLPFTGTNQSSDKNFAAGVNKVRSFLNPDPISGKPRAFIMESCRKTAKQILGYCYRKETAVDEELLREQVRNINDEGPTLLRYGIMAEPRIDSGTGEPNIVLPGKRKNSWTGVV